MEPVKLPPGVQVIVRDWLNANHVLIADPDGTALIDSGYGAHAPRTLALLRAPHALGERRLDRLINTHCHSDHMGGNAAITLAYGSSISVPVDAAPLIERWDTRELLLDYADQHAERFEFAGTIAPGEVLKLGGMDWRALAAPGHDMTALVFYQPEHRVLVSGDALWERGFGVIEPVDRLADRLAAQRATLERIASLDIAVVVPGHGAPFTGCARALEHAFQRLASYEADPLKLARHCLKTFLVFALLARGGIARAKLPAYVGRVACYREYNERFFRLAPAALAELLVGELALAGIVAEHDGQLVTRHS
ncbi:MAG TPA: MBL fold metallo-hydrolase [Burkholderiales bacterium]|nr:MBL fold metallo-hydrolase [Burkholderiales bacterium]